MDCGEGPTIETAVEWCVRTPGHLDLPLPRHTSRAHTSTPPKSAAQTSVTTQTCPQDAQLLLNSHVPTFNLINVSHSNVLLGELALALALVSARTANLRRPKRPLSIANRAEIFREGSRHTFLRSISDFRSLSSLSLVIWTFDGWMGTCTWAPLAFSFTIRSMWIQ